MPVPRTALLALAGAAALAACGSSTSHTPSAPAGTASAALGTLHITGAYIPQPASPDVAAAYFTVTNAGPADALTRADSPETASIDLHKTIGRGTNAEAMVPLSRLDVPSHGSVALSLGHDHLMLMNPKTTLRVGDKVPMTLTFATAGSVTMQVPVVSNTGPDGSPLPADTSMNGMGG